MIHPVDFLADSLGDEVARIARARLDAARADLAERLARSYLAAIPAPDREGLDPEFLYGVVMSLAAFLRERPAGRPKVRVFDPDPERHGWVSTHSVVEMVNDDMPFLVDSVAAALGQRGIGIHLLVHPVLAVARDESGRLTGLGEGAAAESVMHVEIDRQEPAGHAALAAALDAVLAAVRQVVGDWRPMRARLDEAAVELAAAGRPTEDTEEAVAFLSWLHDDHFTFLGYRQFAFDGDTEVSFAAEAGLGLVGDPTSHVFDHTLPLAAMPAELRAFLHGPDLLLITKSNRLSPVHRPVHMDVVGVKRFDAAGRVIGMHAFLGLFTSAAYTMSPLHIPLLRRKVIRARTRAGLPPLGHDAKVLSNVLETYPRDELFQAGDDDLLRTALAIVRLTTRPRMALFVRKDQFERFVSCLVFIPRDRYDTPLRLTIQSLLEQAFAGRLDTYTTQVADYPLARLHLVVRTTPGAIPAVDPRELEARIAEAARAWPDQLQDALTQTHGEAAGLLLARRYGRAFPTAYRERHTVLQAVADIERIETVAAGAPIALALSHPVEAAEHQAHVRLTHPGETVALSAVLPMLEAMGLRVLAEMPHEIAPADGGTVWISDFAVESAWGGPIDFSRRGEFEVALTQVWIGNAESDGFNRLVLSAGLDWRAVSVLRAYAKYQRQAGTPYSQPTIERALADNPEAAFALVRLFLARFDPDADPAEASTADAEAAAVLAVVENADDDRILRRFLNLIRATLRTNFFQESASRPYLALKLDSRAIDDLPLPRPWVEVFVCSPRVEGIHLRGGKVARGGIRWSDRREDFRTEILGLMKAQMVKNAVIVPVGAKGGFVVKHPPAEGGRPALLAEGIACYRTLIRGLLDITDTLVGETVVPPPRVVRHDGDDPYLVVAADKGTASFSDIANALSQEYGFWLGDAFASGGSKGYDHKAMGITARGAWVAVERHFRELGLDPGRDPVTVVGVGDMSGDVFGNAMLRSRSLQLVGAFNHAHIFLDPNPDPEAGFAERERLFREVKSWPDYDPALISPGGGVFSRAAKAIPLSAELRGLLGLTEAAVPPATVIRALLTAPVDLLFFGGIGTYVKASHQSHADVGDRANDPLRVDGRQLKARVVAEGANLALTQAGRIEFAQHGFGGRGGRLNTDAIDNSAGVDTSDHEVNIKILLDALVAEGDLTPKQRDELLVAMTDEVARLVLRDNYLQTLALSVMEMHSPDRLDADGRVMRLLEKSGRLDRALEGLPDEETLIERAAARKGLVRPELAVLLAYAKIWLNDALLGSDLPDDPFLAGDLARTFPAPIRERFAAAIPRHRLRREIVATAVTNGMINRVGIAFVSELTEKSGHGPAEVARAYLVARDAFDLRPVWQAIEDLDGRVPASTQAAMLTEANRLLERATAWVLRWIPAPVDIGAAIAAVAPGIAALEAALDDILPPDLAESVAARAHDFIAHGVPADLARRVAGLIVLASGTDVVRIAAAHNLSVEAAATLYFSVGTRLGLGWLRASAQRLAGRGHWQKLAVAAAIEDLHAHQRDITIRVAAAGPGLAPAEALEAWIAAHRPVVERADALLAEMRAAHQVDLSMLTVGNRALRALSEAVG
ncbi:MAG: NAD-glutamate dehydrogenase [Magnetospirillum sp.]|nr:NAD-glutamate dehydrogenase [Magnetospirillum sp.]